jgi:hypothetical protein
MSLLYVDILLHSGDAINLVRIERAEANLLGSRLARVIISSPILIVFPICHRQLSDWITRLHCSLLFVW